MKQIILIFSLFISVSLFAQEFSTKLYFEAANGEKDTLEIGYDQNATQGIDEIFGEVDYGTPSATSTQFQVFITEIMSRQLHEESFFYLKKQIVKKIFYDRSLQIIIPLGYFPITVTWDSTIFDDKDREYSVFTDWNPVGWWDVSTACLGIVQNLLKNNTLVLPEIFNDDTLCDYYGLDNMFKYILIEGGDTIKYFPFFVGFVSCEEEYIYLTPLDPNPCTNVINEIEFDSEEIIQINVYSISGKKLLNFKGENIKDIDIQNLSNGIYIVVSEDKNHKMNYNKLIKYK